MLIKGIKDECFGDFKDPGMLVVFPNCSFKCDKENGNQICQNSSLAAEPNYEVPPQDIVDRYMANSITKALICGGLEPLDSIHDLYLLIIKFRAVSKDPIVIYTGYLEKEADKILGFDWVKTAGNVYIKYGRFIPNKLSHFDELLGVNLASDNQYAKYYE